MTWFRARVNAVNNFKMPKGSLVDICLKNESGLTIIMMRPHCEPAEMSVEAAREFLETKRNAKGQQMTSPNQRDLDRQYQRWLV